MSEVQFRPASESALMVDFGGDIRLETVQKVHRLLALLDRAHQPGIRELTPSYSSLLVEFNPLELTMESAESHVRFCLEQIGQIELPPADQIEVPVFYGGEYGPDLPQIAERLRMTATQLVEIHCTQIFTVAFFGFLPGFAYLEGWPSKYAVPRLDTPRPKVPAGSVGLAGAQCGIYPRESPGGWRILGRSPLEIVNAQSPTFCRFSLGAKLRFYPANPQTWRAPR
jgi:KipI family sensor histidine kinase inhibitor